MRRLVVEIPLKELGNFPQIDSHLQAIKTAEVLYFLRQDMDEFAVIFKVQLADPKINVEDIMHELHGEDFEMRLLEGENGGNGNFIYFVRGKTLAHHPGFNHPVSSGYLTTPFEVKDGNLRLTLLGNASQIRNFLNSVETMGVRFKIVSLMDAKFFQDSPLSSLTEKQREVLTTAYNLGYYDRPRRISSKDLAERLDLSSSTFVAHRLKAERRLMKAIFEKK